MLKSFADSSFGNHSRGILFLFMIVLLTVSACASGPNLDEPPDIRYGEDVCDRCIMIINEARYASAYVTETGEIRRFDDIGGMVAYKDELGEDVAVYWVHDYETEEWLKAEEAVYVKSQQQTPMGFGIVAFSERERAEVWADQHDGAVLTFAGLFR
jgi:copper chaperone NosL